MRDGRPAKDSDESNKHIFETTDAHALMVCSFSIYCRIQLAITNTVEDKVLSRS